MISAKTKYFGISQITVTFERNDAEKALTEAAFKTGLIKMGYESVDLDWNEDTGEHILTFSYRKPEADRE